MTKENVLRRVRCSTKSILEMCKYCVYKKMRFHGVEDRCYVRRGRRGPAGVIAEVGPCDA